MTDLLAFADELVERVTAALLPELPETPAPAYIHWQRDGLGAVWHRLEVLKGAHAQLVVWDEHAAQLGAAVADALIQVNAAHDDTVAAGLESTVSTQAARGMAADERRIAHDTRAMPLTIRRRRLERLQAQLDARTKIIRARLFGLRDERADLRTQLRAIDLAVEIGEL